MKKVIVISLLLLAIGTVGAFAETAKEKKEREAAESAAAQKKQEWCDTTKEIGKSGNQNARNLWFDECN
jgi:Na+-transporting methylmalonyl-CoA/oxaloacetate decarboxylase gamma subunit